MVRKSMAQACAKTKLCMFNAMNSCKRGKECSFAHDMRDLQPCPDLSYTKFCPMLLVHGVCLEPSCTYAHKKGELRDGSQSLKQATFPTEQQVGNCGAVDQNSQDDPTMHQLGWKRSLTEQQVGKCGVVDLNLQDGPMMHKLGWKRSLTSTTGYFFDDDSNKPGGLTTQDQCFRGRQMTQESTQLQEPWFPPVPVQADGDDMPLVPRRAAKNRNKFAKTKMCTFFLEGRCGKADACSFAHSEQELAPIPDLRNTKLCASFFNTDHCEMGKDCPFAHDYDELRHYSKSAGKSQDLPGDAPPSSRGDSTAPQLANTPSPGGSASSTSNWPDWGLQGGSSSGESSWLAAADTDGKRGSSHPSWNAAWDAGDEGSSGDPLEAPAPGSGPGGSGVQLCVRNTFVCLEPVMRLSQRLRHSHSEPPCPLRSEKPIQAVYLEKLQAKLAQEPNLSGMKEKAEGLVKGFRDGGRGMDWEAVGG